MIDIEKYKFLKEKEHHMDFGIIERGGVYCDPKNHYWWLYKDILEYRYDIDSEIIDYFIKLLKLCDKHKLDFKDMDCSIFYSSNTICDDDEITPLLYCFKCYDLEIEICAENYLVKFPKEMIDYYTYFGGDESNFEFVLKSTKQCFKLFKILLEIILENK